MSPVVTIVIIVAIIIVAAAFWYFLERRRTERLRTKFGPEYDRTVSEAGRRRGESILEHRSERVRKFTIRSLTNDERERFAAEWRREQARFVDDPKGAVTSADRLVMELMRTRGYPMGEFDQRAEDISVDHPEVVQNYRAAHAIALRESRGQATTEDLRQAMVHYRALFEDLLEEHLLVHEEVRK